MTTAPRLPSPPSSIQFHPPPHRPRLLSDAFNLPCFTIQETTPTVPYPQHTDAATSPLASPLMPEPPGRMRRDGGEEVRRGGDGSGRGGDGGRGRGSQGLPIHIDREGGSNANGNGERYVDTGEEEKVVGSGDGAGEAHCLHKEDGVLGREVVDDDGTIGTSLDGRYQANVAQPAHAGPDAPADPRSRRGPPTKPARERAHEGSSVEMPVVIDEGYASFGFDSLAADTSSSKEKWSDPDYLEYRQRSGEIDKLFESNDGGDAQSHAKGTAMDERDRTTMHGNDEGEAVMIEKVNSLLRSRHSRARDWRAEVENSQVRTQDGQVVEHGRQRDRPGSETRRFLNVLSKEAQESMHSAEASKRAEPGRATSVLPRWQAEVAARKRAAVERSRSARASDGHHNPRPTTSHEEAETVRRNQEDDTEHLRLAQERLIADLASRTQAKREREQCRLRKEKEANERTNSVRGTSNAQQATAANQEKPRKKARPARDDEALMAAEAKMIAERREEERRMRTNVDTEAKRKQEAMRFASLQKKAADEAVRRTERNRIDEERRAKAVRSAPRPPIRIKVEDSGSDDAVRSSLARDRAARRAAAERSRSRQAQNGVDEKPQLVGERAVKVSESRQTSVALRLPSSGNEGLVGNLVPLANSSALESKLQRASEALQAAQARKRLLEVEAEARRVQAECIVLKRRAEDADAEDVTDRSNHKKARSVGQGVGVNDAMLGSRNPSSVKDTSSPRETEMQAQGPARRATSEERRRRKREASRRCRSKKQAESKVLQAQRQLGGIQDYLISQQSTSSPTESEDNNGTDNGQKQPMGLGALCTSGLISNGRSLREEHNKVKGGGHSTIDQIERPTNTKTLNPRRDNKGKSHMMRDRAAKDDEIDNLKAQLARFQQPMADQGGEPAHTGISETYPADSPIQQEREDTVSSDEDEDEDENQEARTTQPFRLSVPQQPLDMAEEAQPAPPRPTCARKTLPARIPEMTSEEDDTGTGGSEDQEEQPNEMVWGYRVTRKEWLHEEDPNDVGQTTDGPYWSKDQANSIAATEVHQERGNVKILAPMEFNMTIDALGMRTHSICSKGGIISTAVERYLIPPSRANGPMADKAWLPQKLFVALEKVGVSVKAADPGEESADEHVPPACSIRVLGIFTVLDLANREASRCALDHHTSRLGESGLDEVVRAEKEMKARERLEKLDRDCRTFASSGAVSDGSGVVEIWVEEHPVVGPRN